MAICVKKALEIIVSNIKKVSYEIIPIENAKGRILAEDIFAIHNLPTYNNSAMDGYGVRLADIGKKLTLSMLFLPEVIKNQMYMMGKLSG